MKVYLIKSEHGCCSSIDLESEVFLDLKKAVRFVLEYKINGIEITSGLLEIDTDNLTMKQLGKYDVVRENNWIDLAKEFNIVMEVSHSNVNVKKLS